MTFTVRPAGQIWLEGDAEPRLDVTAVVWFDREEAGRGWGGIIEAPDSAALREQVRGGQRRYWLRLADGRTGLVELALSEFVADGARPITFTGIGALARPEGSM